MAELTRRSFFAGMGSITVGFLFARKLERVLGELEEESFAEVPQVEGQVASAAVITLMLQQAFRPQRLIVRGKKVGTKMVEEVDFKYCDACDGDGYLDLGDECEKCHGSGGDEVKTGRMVEKDIMEYPWVIEDIAINRRSQFVKDAAIPADMFAADAFDANMMMDAVSPGCEMKFRVRYTGTEPDGEIFQGALFGRTLEGRNMVMPISSGDRIRA